MHILSKYNHLYQRNGKYFLYNSQSGFHSEISKELNDILQDRDWNSLPDEVIQYLNEKRVIIDSVDIDTYFYDAKVRYMTSAFSSDTLSIIIVPTTGCNFNCPYCFEPKKNPKAITPEVEDKIIQYFNNQKDITKLNLTWYGGEPLLQIEDMIHLYDRIVKETDKTIVYHSIISNGYLINDKVIGFMRRANVNRIQITLDGIKDNHNKTRSLKGNHLPTYDTIVGNIERLAKEVSDLRISLRVNINKENFTDFIEIYKLYQSKDYHRNIHVYPGIIREDTPDKCRMCHSSYSNSELVSLYEYFGREGVNIDFMPHKTGKGCMIQRAGSFIIGPEGELYKCWNDVSDPSKIIGSIMDDSKRNYHLLMTYMNELNPFDNKCRECSIFPICDGGCGNQRYRNLKENADFDYCSPLKNLENLIKALELSSELKTKPGPCLTL